jgi:TonB-linked SusC/RagA family outer membrane protein
MKQKWYYLLGLIITICLNHRTGFAVQPTIGIAPLKIDTTHRLQTITVKVLDQSSSKLLDSVRVMLGKEAKYTVKGVVVFENTEDSVVVLSKPGYNRLGKKISSSSLIVRMVKTEEMMRGYFVNTALGQNINDVFSGSAVTVTGTALRNVSPLSLVDGLKFYVPALFVVSNNNNGANPNEVPQIRLRGAGNFPFSATIINNNNTTSGLLVAPSAADYIAANITSNSSPVILLDGVQVSVQTVLDIDLNRIKSVTVLKDAAATASYGMRGGNGVISIQTIKPQGRLEISFTEQVQISAANISSFEPLTAKQKLEIEKNSGLFNGVLAPVFQNRYNQAYNNNINTDWLAVPLQNGVGAKHSLALSAGNDDIAYGLNASYNDTEGVMKGSFRKNLDLGAYFGGHFGGFSFNNQFSYLGTDAANSPYGSFNAYVKMNPYWQLNDPYTGKFQKVVEFDALASGDLTYLNPAYNATLSTTDATTYTRYSNLTNLNWLIGSGFQLNGMVSVVKQSDELNYFLSPNHTTFANVTPDNLFTRGMYNYTSNSFMDVQGGIRLQYQNNFGKHQLFANVGQNLSQTSSESEGVSVSGFATDRLADISLGNAYSISKPVSGKIITRYVATFGNFGYSYDGRYQVDLSGSMDYYSGLDKAANFGAVGFSWNVNKEQFLKSVKWIDLLKIKGSLGIAGNQGFLSYLNRTTYNYYTNQQYIPGGSSVGTVGIGLGAYLTGFTNNNLQAPQTYKQDFGLDAAFFNNRLALTFNVFKQSNYRMVLPIASVASTGYQNFSYYDNYGEIENNGVEMSVMATAYKSRNNGLRINIMANAFHATDKITATGPYISNVNNYNNFTASQNMAQPLYVVGQSPYSIWAVPSLGIDAQTGKEIFLKKDGSSSTTWNANDKVFAGNLTPKWLGSLGTDITFRQFSFGAFFNYQYGAKVYNQTMADIENELVDRNFDARVLNPQRWTVGMPNAAYKGLFNSPTYATTRLVQSDNKIQCSSMTLGYKIPKTIAEKINAKNLGVKVMINNAFEIGGADMQRGIYYPFQRNYTFILNANF